MRIVVTGKEGQVVRALSEVGPRLGAEIVTVGRPEMDLAAPATVATALTAHCPDVIVSAAAHTAVDKAECEPDEAFAVNAFGAAAVARAAASLGVPVIHLSTDYVFAGDKRAPYTETDPANPISIYGRSKLQGEQLVAGATPDHVILRTAWVYSPFGANFLKTMLRLSENCDEVAVVADQHGSPTSALDIAVALVSIAKRLVADPDPNLRGVFHLSASGEANWADFAEEIFRNLKKRNGRRVLVRRIGTADYPTPARRPANSRLDAGKLRDRFGIAVPDWRPSTAAVVYRLIEQQGNHS
jgi:dTDP-4-dehydrorhamnose reductase